MRAADAELGYRQDILSEATIPSLVDGEVIKRRIEPGDAVVPGQTMFTVANPRLTCVAAHVDQRFAGQIRPGEGATVILRGREDHPFHGYVYRIEPHADPQVEKMTVDVVFPLPAQQTDPISRTRHLLFRRGVKNSRTHVPQAYCIGTGTANNYLVAEFHKEPTAVFC